MITIERATNHADARELILEYAQSLGVDLSFQHFEEEMQTLDTYYEAIFIARDAGCVALRRIDDETCEMKRLYIRAEFRGTGLGRGLALRVIDEARSRGYKRMRLDTLPTMQKAQKLYEQLGFRDTEAYRYNPVEGSRYMELDLTSSRA